MKFKMNMKPLGHLSVLTVILFSSCTAGPLEKRSMYGRANYSPNGRMAESAAESEKRCLWLVYPYREQSVWNPMIKRCHGRLFHNGKELAATNHGERVETPLGTFEWRGPVGGKPSDPGTGWHRVSNGYRFGPRFR